MTACRFCHNDPCQDDCEELHHIYLQRQKEILKDMGEVDPDEEICYQCKQTYTNCLCD